MPAAELRARGRAVLHALVSRLAARDPAWRRARRALGATLGAIIALVLDSAIASAASQPIGVPLLGAVVAMVAGLSVTEADRRAAAWTFLLLPPIAAGSVALGAALSTQRLAADAVFVVIVFLATALRRRGPRWSACSFLAFMAYFFSQFLHAVPPQVPWLALTATVGVAVAALLRLVVFPERPQSALRQLVRAMEGQAAVLLDTSAAVLGRPEVPPRLRRRVLAASSDLNRVALLVEEQLDPEPAGDVADPSPADPDPRDPADPERRGDSLRDRVFLLEVAGAHVVSAIRGGVREGLGEADRADLSRDLACLARSVRSGRSAGALRAYSRSVSAAGSGSDDAARYRGALHVRRALGEFADAAAALQLGTRDGEPLDAWTPPGPDAGDDPARGEAAEAAARKQADDDREARRLGFRQGAQAAVAVALAIAAGEMLSPTRWYWAAITAYIVFVGADTRVATVRRAVARTAGTFGGLILGLGVAAVVSGSKPAVFAVLFLLVFAAWWLQPVSFFASSVAVTVVLALLYVLLGTYSWEVLVLRMEETLIGAVLGGLAALVLVPSRSSPVVRDAEAEMLDRLADLLQAIRRRRGSGSALRELDSAFQTVRDVTRPVSQGVPGTAARRIEQRVYALSAAAYSARMLVTALLRVPDTGELTDRLEQLTARTEKLAARAHDGVEDLSSLADEKTGGHPAHEDLASTGEAHAHAHAQAADPGDADGRARMHARVALERLDLALSRWCDPLRPPATGAGPNSSAGTSTGTSAAADERPDDVPAPDHTTHPTGATRATADLPLR
ncbi:MAG: hypothetical protein QOJ32_688 [Frankiaceae bacterium]|nr:hypothetical protein [Frankiaceae bacterium]